MKRTGGRFSPLLVALLTALWLMLNETWAPGQILLGLLLGVTLAWWSSSLRPLQAHLRRWELAFGLLCVVFVDIVRSNFNVARVVLGLVGRHEVRSGFVKIPLDLRDPHGLAALAAIVTSTPGTVWSGLSPGGDLLTLHVLDLRNEGEWVRLIKQRYERPLMGIFE